MTNFQQGTRAALNEALPSFYRAIERDPGFGSAYKMAGWCLFWRKINGWMTDRSQEVAEGAPLARRAVELGKNDAVALTRGGHALGHLGGDLDSCRRRGSHRHLDPGRPGLVVTRLGQSTIVERCTWPLCSTKWPSGCPGV
jgi:hypothetical protein